MAHPIGMPHANAILARPAGMTKEECSDLELYRSGTFCVSRWQLTEEDMQELQRNGNKLYVWVMMDPQPPVSIDTRDPWRAV